MTAAALSPHSTRPTLDPARSAGSVLPPGALAIAALEPGGCRWPLGEVEEPTFRFCNTPSRWRSYCEAHRRLAQRRTA